MGKKYNPDSGRSTVRNLPGKETRADAYGMQERGLQLGGFLVHGRSSDGSFDTARGIWWIVLEGLLVD